MTTKTNTTRKPVLRTTRSTAKGGRNAVPARPFIRSGANVFADLGFPAEEAEHLRIRSGLMASLRTLIERQGLTQHAAATLFGVTQPRVSDLVRARIDRFSIDALVDMLARAGCHVELRVAIPR